MFKIIFWILSLKCVFFITVSHLYKRVISVSSFSILRNILLSRHQRLNVYSSFNPSTNSQNKHFFNNIHQLHHSSTKTRMHSIFILFFWCGRYKLLLIIISWSWYNQVLMVSWKIEKCIFVLVWFHPKIVLNYRRNQ